MSLPNPPDTPTHAENGRAKVVVVSPCRNEERTLAATLGCMQAQTHPPAEWVIVDDGSTDSTPEILAQASETTDWVRVVTRPDRGFRKVGGGVVEAFYAGLDTVEVDYDFVVKLDVDLEFSPRYIERVLEWFDANPTLAAASGKIFRKEEDGQFVEEFIIDEQVSGAFKFYRREAFERIGGFVREVMWDGIDFHRARMEGYITASIPDPVLRITHLRLMGSTEKNIFRGRMRWGRGQWFMGSAFVYIAASGVFRMRERPRIIGGLLIILGFLWAALRMVPRYEDPRFRRALRSWQRQRLWNLMRRRRVDHLAQLTEPDTGT